MKRAVLILPIFLALIVGLFTFTLSNNPSSQNSFSQGINYESEVCIFKNNNLVECKHNVLYTDGGEAIKENIGNGVDNGPFLNISLCNSSTAGVSCGGVTAGQSESYNLFSAGGLTQKEGTYFSNGNGNWTVSATFTATASSLTTNVTKLSNRTGSNLSGASFTAVTLNTDDQITINWTLWVT